jgi:hypothetical protein
MSGEKIKQSEIKDIWDKDHTKENDRIIRGPIVCPSCDQAHYYIKGAVPALRLGQYEEAKSVGVEGLLAEGEMDE